METAVSAKIASVYTRRQRSPTEHSSSSFALVHMPFPPDESGPGIIVYIIVPAQGDMHIGDGAYRHSIQSCLYDRKIHVYVRYLPGPDTARPGRAAAIAAWTVAVIWSSTGAGREVVDDPEDDGVVEWDEARTADVGADALETDIDRRVRSRAMDTLKKDSKRWYSFVLVRLGYRAHAH